MTIAAVMVAGAAFAEEVSAPAGPVFTGSIETELTQNPTTDKLETETTIGFGVAVEGVAYGNVSVESIDGNTFEIDEYVLGTKVGQADVSFGDRDGVFVEAVSDYANLDEPAIAENLQVKIAGLSVAAGFTDVQNDAADISNVQAAYALSLPGFNITASGDYNLDSEKYIVGGRVASELGAGATVTYAEATEVVEFEVDYQAKGLLVYLNGDQDDVTQNVGAGYSTNFNGLTLGADVNYNFDSEDITPRATVTFSF